MDDTPSSAWKAYGYAFIFLIAVAVLGVSCTTKAHAQDRSICAPADVLFKQFGEVVKEKIIWEGSMPLEQGVLQFVLFQNEKGNWTLFIVQDGIACLRAQGQNGTPNDLGKGV